MAGMPVLGELGVEGRADDLGDVADVELCLAVAGAVVVGMVFYRSSVVFRKGTCRPCMCSIR